MGIKENCPTRSFNHSVILQPLLIKQHAIFFGHLWPAYFTDVSEVLLTALKGIHLFSLGVFDQSLILIKIIKIIFLELL